MTQFERRSALVCSVFWFALAGTAFCAEPATGYPPERRATYRDMHGAGHIYLIQQPAELPAQPRILIYMHGAGGMEEQGMDPVWLGNTFSRLRRLMNQWRWVYVCPRDHEFRGLLKHLREKYQPSEVYLAGASAGGRDAFTEALDNPNAYKGLLLLCPAMYYPSDQRINVQPLKMPIWIETGEKDDWTPFSRELVKDLQRDHLRHAYEEIPGGDHGSPLKKINWEKALRFISGEIPDGAPSPAAKP